LGAAVDALERGGFDRAAISVLGAAMPRSGAADAMVRSAADDPATAQATFVSPPSQMEGKAVAIAVPLEIGGFAGAWAVAAAGGALITALGATILGGAVGAGLGVLLFRTVAKHHQRAIEKQVSGGGLLLWVRTPDDLAEVHAQDVLRRCGGHSVHAHTFDRDWGVADVPLSDVQPDPFLEHDPHGA
jgi:hypothetical protein